MDPKPYPLHWPESIRRTRIPKRSRFKANAKGENRNLVYAELNRMKATHIVISTNIRLRADGEFRASENPDNWDHGVAVYFRRRGHMTVIACDQYDLVGDNLRAIAKTLEAMRAVERYGSQQLADQMFSAFTALPPAQEGAAPKMRHWREVFGIGEDMVREDALDLVETRYKRYVKECHPDRHGGGDFKMMELNGAIKMAREDLR